MKIIDKDNNIIDNLLAEKIFKMSGENVYLCYQCKKCTSGCPSNSFMENTPTELIRFVQLGMIEKIMKGNTIWFCLSCQTCTTRCPQGIDIAHIIDTIKIIAQNKKIKLNVKYSQSKKRFKLFNSLWMRILKYMGRMYEPGLISMYNLFTGNPFKDLELGFKMMKNRKLKFIPSIKRPLNMMKIFSEARRIK